MAPHVTREVDWKKPSGNWNDLVTLPWDLDEDESYFASYEVMLLASRLLTDLGKDVCCYIVFDIEYILVGLGNNIDNDTNLVQGECRHA